MQAHVFEGYFDNGKFYNNARKVINIPEQYKVYITLSDERFDKETMPDTSKKRPLGDLIGKWKDKVQMADDFDAPLEEMKEYM